MKTFTSKHVKCAGKGKDMSSKNSRKKGYSNINFAAAVTCFVVILIIVLVVTIGSRNKPDDTDSDPILSAAESISEQSVVSEQETSLPEESSEPDISFTTVSLETASFHEGDLIVVNPTYAMAGEPTDQIIKLWEKKTANYKLSDLSVTYSERLVPELNNMLDALYASASSGALTISTGYRTVEEQQKAHDSKRNINGREPVGGCSDLNTGLSFTAWVYPSTEGKIGEGKFAWLSENCYEYGYIVRYPAGKSNLTGIDASADTYVTYRYVGTPHSYLISLNAYCLEEYVEFVTRFNVDSRYSFSREGVTYEIYYVKAADGETTEIPVPVDCDYTVSGDNIGGFIVTITR